MSERNFLEHPAIQKIRDGGALLLSVQEVREIANYISTAERERDEARDMLFRAVARENRLQAERDAAIKEREEAMALAAPALKDLGALHARLATLEAALKPFAEVPLLKHLERDAEGEIRIDEVRLYGAEIVGVAAYVKVSAFQAAKDAIRTLSEPPRGERK